MADNILLNAGSGGSTLAADDVSSVWYQQVKLVDGTADSTTPINVGNGTAANALRVTVASDTTGVLSIDDNGGSITIDNADITSIKTAVEIIDNAISGNEMQVDIVAALPAGTNAIGKLAANSGVDIGDVDVLSVTPGTGASNLGKAEDAAHTTGDVGVMALSVRTNTATARSGTDGDYQPLITDTNGRLHVKLPSNEAVNVGQMNGTAVTMGNGASGTGVQRVTLASDSTGQVALATGTNSIGKLAANSGVDIGDVDVISSALPTGAATSANQLPATSGGISTVFRDEDIDETAVACKASAGQVYWIHCINLDATPVYLHFYDVAAGSTTPGTTPELCSFAVPSQGDANGAGFTMHFNHGIEFSTAITVACTTTIGGTAGPGANEVILNVGYE